ncbi:MAG: VOC family protein [Gemmatimonadales bacterium]
MSLVPRRLDHLVYATPNLEAALTHLERILGVRPLPGGVHPAWGTRNALLSLGPESYLEVIGPDPERSLGTRPTIFGIATLQVPTLVTWAAKATNLASLVEQARQAGIDLGRPAAGNRVMPDGTDLRWQLTDPFTSRGGGLFPFFIDWGAGPHPGASAPWLELIDFHARHPRPEETAGLLRKLGLDLRVLPGTAPILRAVVRAPAGMVTLE